MNSSYEEFDECVECPACGGEGQPLGSLGVLAHFRCRDCGAQFSTSTEGEQS